MPSQSNSIDTRPTSPVTFTVRVEQHFHVTLEVPFDGHPDFADTEAIERALEDHLETGASISDFDGARLDFATVSAEAEAW